MALDFGVTKTAGDERNAALAMQAQNKAMQNIKSSLSSIGGKLKQAGTDQALNPLIQAQEGSNLDLMQAIQRAGVTHGGDINKHLNLQKSINEGSQERDIKQKEFLRQGTIERDRRIAEKTDLYGAKYTADKALAYAKGGGYNPTVAAISTAENSTPLNYSDVEKADDIFGDDATDFVRQFRGIADRDITQEEFDNILAQAANPNSWLTSLVTSDMDADSDVTKELINKYLGAQESNKKIDADLSVLQAQGQTDLAAATANINSSFGLFQDTQIDNNRRRYANGEISYAQFRNPSTNTTPITQEDAGLFKADFTDSLNKLDSEIPTTIGAKRKIDKKRADIEESIAVNEGRVKIGVSTPTLSNEVNRVGSPVKTPDWVKAIDNISGAQGGGGLAEMLHKEFSKPRKEIK